MNWELKIAVQPASEPITLAELKLHARVDTIADDGLLAALITAARQQVEEITGRAAMLRSLVLSLSAWPLGRSLRLPFAPVSAVSGITYSPASGGGPASFDPAKYLLVPGEPARIVLARDQSWPSDELAPGLPIEISYSAGYSSAADVPQILKQAVLLQAARWYDDRVGNIPDSGVSDAIHALTGLLRVRYDGPEGLG